MFGFIGLGLRGVEIAIAQGADLAARAGERAEAAWHWVRQSEVRLGPPAAWTPGRIFEGDAKDDVHRFYRKTFIQIGLRQPKTNDEWWTLSQMGQGLSAYRDDPFPRMVSGEPISTMHTGDASLGDLAMTASVQGFMGPVGAAIGVARVPLTAWLSMGLAAVLVLGAGAAWLRMNDLASRTALAEERSKQWQDRSATAELNFERVAEARRITEQRMAEQAEESARLMEEATARRQRLQRREMERANADQANRDDVAGAVERRLRDLAQPASVPGMPGAAGGVDPASGVSDAPAAAGAIPAADKPAG
jgi:hypothetical protein